MAGRILALDLGTTSVKALVVDTAGHVVASHEVEVPLASPAEGLAEQDPGAILAAVRAATSAVLGCGPFAGTALSCAMHGLIALDAHDLPLTPCITWADQRARAQARRLQQQGLAHGLLARTGTPVHALSPLVKLLWLREHEPGLHARARRFVSAKEWVLHALGGGFVVDWSIASATGLLALEQLAWDEQAMALAGIDADRLSQLVPPRHVVHLPRGGGLPDAPVVIGASDGALANLGAGATRPGILAVTLGTSGAARAVVEQPLADPRGELFCYALDARQWVIGGATSNAGLALRWLARLLGLDGGSARDELARLVALAAKAPSGAGGVRCTPRFAGERFAAWPSTPEGAFTGLTLEHGKEHLVRAALEGVLWQVGTIVRAIEACTGPATEVRLGGGMAAAPLVRQMLADVLGRRVAMLASEQSSALGAARLGFSALGIPADWPDAVAFTHEPGSGT